MLSVSYLIEVFVRFLIIMFIGVYSGKKVKDATDFPSGGHKSSPKLVAGTIIEKVLNLNF